jgi:F-type H+-transporting ATPase subunit gamma
MASTKVIKGKIKAVTSIKKITKTMEMVAVSKMKKSVGEAVQISDYMREIKYVINRIKSESQENHHYFTPDPRGSSSELVIIFASNKGLCGSFNSNIYKKTRKLIEENPNIKYAICFGKFAEKVARKLNLEVKFSNIEIEKIIAPTQLNKTETFVRKLYENKEISKVHAVYTNFIKMGLYEPRTVTLYPVNKNLDVYTETLNVRNNVIEGDSLHGRDVGHSSTERVINQIYTFEPSIGELIDKTIPKIIKMILYSFVIESRASENSSRSFAMKRANESAGEMLGTLKITFNKIRQDGITQEIAEISAGANVQ